MLGRYLYLSPGSVQYHCHFRVVVAITTNFIGLTFGLPLRLILKLLGVVEDRVDQGQFGELSFDGSVHELLELVVFAVEGFKFELEFDVFFSEFV